MHRIISGFNLTLLFTLFLSSQLVSCSSESEFSVEEPEIVTSGFQFTEGPYWHPDGYLIFSDIPANRIYQWTPGSSESTVYLEPSGNSNGIIGAPDGSIVVAQHAGRVSRMNENRELIPIVEQYDGKRLNSPNDVAVRSDGLIYFTDPHFGVSEEDRELDISGVYRINQDGSLTLVYDGFSLPNGITFSPDETVLYVNNSETGDINRFEVLENGDVGSPELFVNIGARAELGAADGMITDSDGRLYTTGPNGFIVFDDEGNQLEQIRFEHRITNLAWGGEDGNDLFMTSPNDIYRIRVNK